MSRIYVALDLKINEGRGVSLEVLRELVEEALPGTVEDGATVYDITVLGLGTSVKDLQDSMTLRRRQ